MSAALSAARVPFNYKRFVDSLAEKEKAWRDDFRQGKVAVDAAQLASQSANPYKLLYREEHASFLERPELVQQHRMQCVRVANQGHNQQSSTFVVLRIDDTFLRDPHNYFGTNLESVARQCDPSDKPDQMPGMIPMVLEPDQYRDPDIENLYTPLFRTLHEKGQAGILAFANRMEDCLAIQRFGRDSWASFRDEQIGFFSEKGLGNAQLPQIGDLPGTQLDRYLGERVAWLKLLELDDFAQDLTDLALKEEDRGENLKLARDMAFILHNCFIGPIFYAHKANTVLHGPFDTRDSLIEPLTNYAQYILRRQQEGAELGAQWAGLLMLAAGYVGASALVEGQGLTLPWFISETVGALQDSHDVWETRDPLRNFSSQFNLDAAQNITALGSRSDLRVEMSSKHLLQVREALMELRMSAFSGIRNVVRVLVRMIPAVISVSLPGDLNLSFITKIVRTLGRPGQRLANLLDRLLDRMGHDLFKPQHPMFQYQPSFRVYDFSQMGDRLPAVAV